MKRLGVAVLLIAVVGCSVPRDPEGTLARVRSGVLRAGYTSAPPFADGPVDDPTGVEVDVVEGFAEELGASVEWTEGSEAELLKALEVRALDIVVGGFDSTNPLVAAGGVTRPYTTTVLTVGVPEDDPLPKTLEGLTVAAEAGSEAIGLLRKADANVQVATDIAEATGPAAVEEWLLDDLGLVDSGHHLAESKHVLATPPGENAWLVELERYLFRNRTAIEDALVEAGEA